MRLNPNLLPMRRLIFLFATCLVVLCLEVFPKWDKNTLTIASSNDEKKIQLHVSTTGMRVKNIPQAMAFTKLVSRNFWELRNEDMVDIITVKCSFSLQMLGSPKYNE